ncbi:MAG: tetraacyldisaccharide 4'-kinase [Pseudomonadota bacterium]
MKEPWFWRDQSLAAQAAAAAMAPAALLYDLAQRLRAAITTPREAGAPVICVGNATLGGSGKTPFALMLQKLLSEQGVTAHFSSRGYGGALSGPLRVTAEHTAPEVGDEPLLLAATAPAWIAKNRAAGAAAAAIGAGAVIMDDGFQNPTVKKACAILLVSAEDAAGAGRLFPAGPLREPLARAIGRADAVVIVGGVEANIDTGGAPIFHAASAIETSVPPQKCVAFCGIGNPGRFFADLAAKGFDLRAQAAFADHHFFTEADLAALRRSAKKEGAILLTTEKDFVRLPAAAREGVALVRLKMTVDDPQRLTALTLSKIGRAQ